MRDPSGWFRHPPGAVGPGVLGSGPYGDSAMTQLVRLAPQGGDAGRSPSGCPAGWAGPRREPGYATVPLTFLDWRGGPVGRAVSLPR